MNYSAGGLGGVHFLFIFTTPSILLHHLSYLLWLGYSSVSWPWPSPRSKLAIGPAALGHHNPTVRRLACRWQLRSALRADQEFVSIGNPRHPTSPTHPTPSCPTTFGIHISLCKKIKRKKIWIISFVDKKNIFHYIIAYKTKQLCF